MEQRHFAWLAALLVGVIGWAAFGDDHGGGPLLEDCSQVPLMCYGQCYELNACRSAYTPIGSPDCQIEESNLDACKSNPPPFVPPVIIVPPPACPAGMHLHEGTCHADHVCGSGQSGGGAEDCVDDDDDSPSPNEVGRSRAELKMNCIRDGICVLPTGQRPRRTSSISLGQGSIPKATVRVVRDAETGKVKRWTYVTHVNPDVAATTGEVTLWEQMTHELAHYINRNPKGGGAGHTDDFHAVLDRVRSASRISCQTRN